MTIKDDVIAAFGKLSASDDALWNKDGTPKLEAIRNAAGDQKISRDEMIASIGDLRRPEMQAPPAPPPEQAAPPAPPAPTEPDDKPDTVNAQKPQVDGVEDTETPDKQKLIAEAQKHIDVIDEQAKEVSARVNKAVADMDALTTERKKHEKVIAANTVHLTHAEAVKRVQEQTQRNLAGNKERMALAKDALAASGFKPAPSQLDAALTNRKRTPEAVAAMATYHKQQGADRLAERLGQV